ncbi:hypothetical protein JDV02_002664 [Purpureocillium takamizusanense]|uniref:Zn(2)-C6 fungal-type domain-containing protein n=1 Tax=Purpureocillium takamizusanense TaxID=2060973 RepID=A0A9Q8V8U1_9HYPO|nr:uncharacterized protein JDV02_002664 [Purpureocillium takamizusanense]UNI16204.1 hypothetical protein JDV02_002664 [Purpureocillium takamizusanense]
MGRQPRQRPISCALCRVRKLRCSRVFPCSNCTSRGVACEHEGSPHGMSLGVAPGSGIHKDAPVASSATADLNAVDLLSRLERLEALVASQAAVANSSNSLGNGSTDAGSRASAEPSKQRLQRQQSPLVPPTRRPGSNHQQQQQQLTFPPPPAPAPSTSPSTEVPSRLQRLTADVLWLERSCSGQKLLDSLVADPITFRTCPIRLISKPSSFIVESDGSPAALGTTEVVKCIWLPRRDEAQILVQKYVSDVSHFHHIIHFPTLPRLIDDIYDGIERDSRVDVGGILLLLSICTCTTYAWTPYDDARALYASAAEANCQTTGWLKAGLDVVDHVQRTAHTSLECAQGMILIFFVLCSLEGVSTRARSLVSQSIAMGRELSLHLIDFPNNSPASDPQQMHSIKTEMGRRVWWYLAASDWMLSQFSVPQEGTYTVLPSHMVVRKPRNANDRDIVEGQEVIDRPIEEPTCVSYLLQRIRLAEVCHGLLDRSPFVMSPETMEYRQVMEVDTRLNQFMQEMPSFFWLDNPSMENLPPSDPRRTPSITVQRYTLNILLNRQLCKLHLPYLARGSVEPAFAYSREQCLKSARTIIHIEHKLRGENLTFVSFRQRMNMVLRSGFVACIALVLDACLVDDSQDTIKSGVEVADAWSILNEARDQSPLASKLLELSIQVLKKHKASHPALELLKNQPSAKLRTHGGTPPMTPDSSHRDDSRNGLLPQPANPDSETAYLEQQWQQLQGRMDLDNIDWDRLFWGLDAPFI